MNLSLKNGEIVGHLSSGTYSHTLGSAVGLGYIPASLMKVTRIF